ncbi:hypothetical protein XELAEV_18012731mg [Xenopus laevis]|uniref:Uncharacterized protein n=1 Tax=Xenopus laevis TaxID=8355 RepID=A0A974DN75_XENLA|nr:hypothetical protein XELAEV_18012731mg [Xenopus laevis]
MLFQNLNDQVRLQLFTLEDAIEDGFHLSPTLRCETDQGNPVQQRILWSLCQIFETCKEKKLLPFLLHNDNK